MNYYQNLSQLNNSFVQSERQEYQQDKLESKEKDEAEKETVLGITAPLGEGSAMDLLKTGIEKTLSKQGVSKAKKEVLNKTLSKISNGDITGALKDAKKQGVDFVKTKATDLVETVKSKVPGVRTAMDKLQGKIPDYKVLKKNLRKSIKSDLDKFKGFEEKPEDNPYSPRNFLASLRNDNTTNDADRLKNRIRSLQTKKDLGLMNDEQEEAFDKLQSKIGKLKELKLRPPSDIETISADASEPPKIGVRGSGAKLGQFRSKVLSDNVQPTMENLNEQAQSRLKLLNENFGTEGSAGAGKTAPDESLSVPTPTKPQQDPNYLKQVEKIKSEGGEKFKPSPEEEEGSVEKGIEESAEGDFSPVADVIGLGISLAGLLGGFGQHHTAIPKAPIPTQGAIQIGADQA